VLTLCGGVAFKPQVVSLFHGAHIVVGTPGRVLKHLEENNFNVENITTLVLDEADKMLDMGFYEDIMKIVDTLPKNRQSLLFSATYEQGIEKLSSAILKDAVMVKDETEKPVQIQQLFYESKEEQKTTLIRAVISQQQASSVLIFCNTKIKCDELANELFDLGLDVLTLHSDLEQKERDETMILFSNKSYPVLIATDVASRGLHIDDIDLVINYDLAQDDKIHTHRIGRTARAGKGGVAISLYENFEKQKVEELQEVFPDISIKPTQSIIENENFKIDSLYRSIFINGGKKQKLRKGDILGALTAAIGLDKNDIGKIDSLEFCSYVAVKKEVLQKALKGLESNRIKGKFFRVFEK
jgi:ATP-independent RNA helicase DbpA